jgi:hypothetical protein
MSEEKTHGQIDVLLDECQGVRSYCPTLPIPRLLEQKKKRVRSRVDNYQLIYPCSPSSPMDTGPEKITNSLLLAGDQQTFAIQTVAVWILRGIP